MSVRLAIHEAGHILAAMAMPGTTHIDLLRGDGFYEVRPHPIVPPTFTAVFDALTSGYVAEAFYLCDQPAAAIDLLNSSDDPLEWARNCSPAAEFDIELLQCMDKVAIRASHRRLAELFALHEDDLFRTAFHLKTAVFDRLRVGESTTVWVAARYKHLDDAGLRELVARQLAQAERAMN